VPDILPILPLRNTVLFPGIIIPITVGREKSIKLIREAYKKDKIIGTVAQRNPNVNEPTGKDIYKVGTVAQILKILEMPDNSTSVIIQGKKRFEINGILSDEPYLTANIDILKEKKPTAISKEFNALIDSLKDLSLRIIQMNNNVPPEAAFAIRNIENT
jgi:ATP-dependent Lon protease